MPNKVAIAFDTRDKPAQVKRVVEHLLQPDLYDLFWFDGSDTPAGQRLPLDYAAKSKGAYAVMSNVRGGPDAGFVQAITTLLNHPNGYTHVGLVEDDCLLHADWYGAVFALFARGAAEGLHVGAVSARAYADRCLNQRDGYAVMHNLGWGHIIFTREAATLTLNHYRTGWTTENRRVFSQISGRDIATIWGWRGMEQWICADWGADAVLAQNGLVSLALTPSLCEMINQSPPLDEQGLRLVNKSVDILRDDRVFTHIVEQTNAIRAGTLEFSGRPRIFQLDDGGRIYFAHQIGNALTAQWIGEWALDWSLGFGPFNFRADSPDCALTLKLAGPVEFMIGGGEKGGKVLIRDFASGYEVEPELAATKVGEQAFMQIAVPASVSWRTIRVDKITPGIIIYGVKTREAQPINPAWVFDSMALPRIATRPALQEAAE